MAESVGGTRILDGELEEEVDSREDGNWHGPEKWLRIRRMKGNAEALLAMKEKFGLKIRL